MSGSRTRERVMPVEDGTEQRLHRWQRAALRVVGMVGLALGPTCVFAANPVAEVRLSFDRHGVTATQVRGLADVATQRAVSADDPVRVASISKLVTALGVMRLVEAKKLDLDADVSTLLDQPLRNPAFPGTPITLRMLLSHTSSLTDAAGYWNVPLAQSLGTLTDNPKAWDAQHAPGTFFRYSNLNFPVVAGLMERATGERFDLLMQRLVLRPLRVDACFNWAGCSPQAIARAVVLYDAAGKPQKDDLHGAPPTCTVIPATDGGCDLARWRSGENGVLYSPQGGLRISANGLARIGRMLLNEGRIDGVRFLKPASVRMMLAPQWRFDGSNGAIGEEDEPARGGFFCSYGLATQQLARGNGKTCRDDLFGDGRARVGHSGNAYGLLSGLWIDRAGGTGVAYFGTGLENTSGGAASNFSAFEERMAQGR